MNAPIRSASPRPRPLTLSAWLDGEIARVVGGGRTSRTALCKQLSALTDSLGCHVSFTTIKRVAAGYRLRDAEKANALSRATFGAVLPREMLVQP